MNLSRLMVLGLLNTHGPQHGHQIRLVATKTDVTSWGGIQVGALYRELRRLDEEQMVQAVAVEQVGRRPIRTVYEITDAGRDELRSLREQAICELRFGPDSLAVALLFGRIGDPVEMRELMERRRQTLAETIEDLAAEQAEHVESARITALDAALFHRQQMLLEAELRWHDEFDELISAKEE